MALHPLARNFAAVAEAYERGRPDHPPAVVGALAAALGLTGGEPILDLGAGTGKHARALLAHGLNVIAVEPQPELSRVLAGHLGDDRVAAGTAEAIPFPDGAFAGVTVADAFHWFDGPRAVGEIARVLRPGGALAVIWTVPDWSEASWSEAISAMITGLRPEHPGYSGSTWRDVIAQAGTFGPPEEFTVTVRQPRTTDQILDHVVSMSWIAGMAADEQGALLQRAREVIDGGTMPAEGLPVSFVVGFARTQR